MGSIVAILTLGLLTSNIVAFTKVYYLIFAVLTIVGGIMGYVKAKSFISLVSGSISGGMLVACEFPAACAAHPGGRHRALRLGAARGKIRAGFHSQKSLCSRAASWRSSASRASSSPSWRCCRSSHP